MSAFFKSSGSPGAGLPWDSPPSTPQRGTELSPAEVKEPRSIPLKMCQVSRKQCPPDTENRYCMLEVYSFLCVWFSIDNWQPKLTKTAEREHCEERFLASLPHIFSLLVSETSSSPSSFSLSLPFCLLFLWLPLSSISLLVLLLPSLSLFPPLSLSLSLRLLISTARYFEVISSSRKNSVFLRAKDPAMAQSWYSAIQAGVANLLPRVKEEMKTMQPGMEVKHLGWITEQVCKNTDVHCPYGKTCPAAFCVFYVCSCCFLVFHGALVSHLYVKCSCAPFF